MKNKLFAFLLPIVSLALVAVSCSKDNLNVSNYLRLSHDVISITGTGSQKQFHVESELLWSLQFLPAEVSWLTVDTRQGLGDKTITITATRPVLPNGEVRTVNIIAPAPGNPFIMPVKLTVLQKDSTYKK